MALSGIAVNLVVVALLARAERQSLNVRGAYLHIVTDLAAFVGTALAAGLILLTGWDRFDPLASLLVAGLMFAAAWSLLRESGRIFLEGAPASTPPSDVGRAIVRHPGVVETHDLHVWTVTDGFPALSAHVLVQPGADRHRIRLDLDGFCTRPSGSTTRRSRWSMSGRLAGSRSAGRVARSEIREAELYQRPDGSLEACLPRQLERLRVGLLRLAGRPCFRRLSPSTMSLRMRSSACIGGHGSTGRAAAKPLA